jgi:hypothetical protein
MPDERAHTHSTRSDTKRSKAKQSKAKSAPPPPPPPPPNPFRPSFDSLSPPSFFLFKIRVCMVWYNPPPSHSLHLDPLFPSPSTPTTTPTTSGPRRLLVLPNLLLEDKHHPRQQAAVLIQLLVGRLRRRQFGAERGDLRLEPRALVAGVVDCFCFVLFFGVGCVDTWGRRGRWKV